MIKKLLINIKKEIINLLEIPILNYPNSKLANRLRKLYFKRKLRIGNNPLILNNFDIRSRDLIKIGNDVQINKNVTMDATGSLGIYIGNKVSIAPGCYIRSANHSFSKDGIAIQDQGWDYKNIQFKNKEYSVVIEDDVWIGANSIILLGAHIGKGSVLNAGSVVSYNIPAYSIAVGNPARVVANRKMLEK